MVRQAERARAACMLRVVPANRPAWTEAYLSSVSPSRDLIGERVTRRVWPTPRVWRAMRPPLILVALAAGLVLGLGFRKVPTGPASGTALYPSGGRVPTLAAATLGPGAQVTFRVGTYNIDGARGLDNRVDLHRTAAHLAGCDLVGLNEVHGRTLGDRRDQAQRLGQDLGMPWMFFPVEQRWWHDDFGNAVLCKLPVTHWDRWPLSPNGASSNRNLNLVAVKVGDRTVQVLITHLGRHEERPAELSQVLDLFQSLATPAILMGDLNTPESDPILQSFLKSGRATDVLARLSEDQRRGHIDWILVRGLECSAAGVAPKGDSDHPFYWANLSVAR